MHESLWQFPFAANSGLSPSISSHFTLLQLKIAQNHKNPLFSRDYSPFVSNFVAMATRVSWGKILLAVFDGPTPKTPL